MREELTTKTKINFSQQEDIFSFTCHILVEHGKHGSTMHDHFQQVLAVYEPNLLPLPTPPTH
jgi:hypothetical protein